MIKTAIQLKAKVKNLSGGDSAKAQVYIRNYMMERFLERCAISKYRNNFIFKGGMFIASYVGIDSRATMDIDATVQAVSLTLESATSIIQEIIDIKIDDNVSFTIVSAKKIMDSHDYPGLRFMLDGHLEQLTQPIQIDISTGDIITPSALEYSYRLMFEDRAIIIFSYNLETILAEKIETIVTRAEANTRMRDFYDVYILLVERGQDIRINILIKAFSATIKSRRSEKALVSANEILNNLKNSNTLKTQWDTYRKNSFYVGEIEWANVIDKTILLAQMMNIIA